MTIKDVEERAKRYKLTADPLVTAQTIQAEFGTTFDDAYLGYVIWNETGFPSFWNIPAGGATAQECFENQLREWFGRVEA